MNVAAGCQKDPPAVWTSVLAALATIQHQQQCLAESLQHQQTMLSAQQQAFASQQQHLSLAQERMAQRIALLENRAQDDCQGDHQDGPVRFVISHLSMPPASRVTSDVW